MSCESITRQVEAPVQADPQSTKPVEIEQVVEVVRRDSHADAEQYLDETEVPHGGE
jgi:hypothetical protein